MGDEWHTLSAKKTLLRLKSSEDGLSENEAKARLEHYGPNELVEKGGVSPFRVLLNQFKGIMILILFFAAFVSAVLGEFIDSLFIVAIIILNAVLGFVQEYRAERALEALKKLTTPQAQVIRDGVNKEVLARELVVGDIIVLDEGKKIPADARLIRASSLRIDESMLTGESTATQKQIAPLKSGIPSTDMTNRVFMGTLVTAGNALAVVTETGMGTSMGKITELVQSAQTQPTLLQIRLDKLAKILALFVVLISAFTFVLGMLSGQDLVEMFLVTVSLAVSAVPEGLPAIITVTLALGVQRMARKDALVRRLPAVESLGSANIICTDKTGTLTKNQMTVREYAFAHTSPISVTGLGYEPKGEFFSKKNVVSAKNPLLREALISGVLCNNSSLQTVDHSWDILGDHTEGALLVAARKAGISHEKLKEDYTFFKEFPFTSERKRMSIVFKTKNKYRAYVKGAPELLLDQCVYYYDGKQRKKLTKKERDRILTQAGTMADRALRVLLLARNDVTKNVNEKSAETNLTFIALVGMIDPPREEVKESIMRARNAGIRTIMITGDHANTARAIAKEVGLVEGDVVAITGSELDIMHDDELMRRIEKVSVFARVSPEHKVRILQILMRDENNFVAMTGDGVNDAPAIKSSHIGISMGLRGTDVAKESSDIILLDDNYATIVSAVEEGRNIYENITKFVRFLLSVNFSELFLVGIAAIAGFPLPLLALQILWLNIVTDGLPALALGVDTFHEDVMKRPPRKPKEGMIHRMLFYALVGGIFAFGTELLVFLLHLENIDLARTMVFSVAVVFELAFVFSSRTLTKSMFRGLFKNWYLLLAVLFSFALQLFAIYTGFMNSLLSTVPLSLMHWVEVFAIAISGVIIVDVIKVLVYHVIKKDV
ncbi:ATPase [archaeon CG10_big_fil_rev_8_21_14_0_10_43_11]|nr:MAG: ATPase [archaeon CG10_big_fil_rev_8_21_14_0_10_43_11]